MTESAYEPLGAQEVVLLAAFEGWNDAGGAATDALDHLHALWDGEEVGEIDPENYHDFQVNRPSIGLDEDGRRSLIWPRTTLVRINNVPDRPQVFVVHGIEPSMRWRGYCDELLDLAMSLGATTVLTLGALLADVPHTRPIPVTVTSDDPLVRARLQVEASTYEGPVGIVAVLAAQARERGLSTVSVWAAVPHYVAHPPSPKATVALLDGLERLLGRSLPHDELDEDARSWQEGVDELANDDPEIAEYVRRLEETKDTVDLPEASGDAIAEEFEQYLRRRDQGS